MAVDLTTNYLGVKLANPLVVAACPLTQEISRLQMLEQAGASAAVMYSLFAEQSKGDQLRQLAQAAVSNANATSCGNIEHVLPHPNEFVTGIDGYLKNIELAKKSVTIPIIGSLNGGDFGDWTQNARLIEQAGADALELNVCFIPTDPYQTSSQVEEKYIRIVTAVRNQIKIPLSVKLGPFFSSLANVAIRLNAEGVDGLVLFNRFMQPDIDTQTLEVSPRLKLSTSDEVRLPLRWIGILRSQLSISLAASTGAHCAEDVAKLILAGADVVSMASALMSNGPGHLTKVLGELVDYMESKNFESTEAMKGFVHRMPGTGASAFERANYVKTIVSYEHDDPDIDNVNARK